MQEAEQWHVPERDFPPQFVTSNELSWSGLVFYRAAATY